VPRLVARPVRHEAQIITQFVLCLASGDQALREGRYADAEQALTAALALEPRSVKVHFKLGLTLEHQRQ